MTTNLDDRLHPHHLTAPSPADIHEAVKEKAAEAKDETPDQDPRSKPKYTFRIHYVTARGDVYDGEFVVRIPTVADRDMIHIIQAGMKGGYPDESFGSLARELHLIQAHLQVCLESRPAWANKLGEIYDFALLQEIFREVRSHEAYFLGWTESSPQGPGERPERDGGTS